MRTPRRSARCARARSNGGVARGFEVVSSGLARTIESVEVTIAFSATTPEMCTIGSTALRPATLHLRVEPRSWTDWIAKRFGMTFETADRDFDEHWHVETDDEATARRLLDERVRRALIQLPIWCRATYAKGLIELRLDSGTEKLTGEQLLAGTELAVAMARATPAAATTPYR